MLKRTYFFLSCAVLIAVAGCDRKAKTDEAVGPKINGNTVTFPTHAPQLSTLTVAPAEASGQLIRRFTGRVTWDEDATVRIYSPVAGRVRSLEVTPGHRIEANAPLAKIDSPDFGQAQAELSKAKADLLLAERTLNRTKDLFEHGAAARKDLDNAENMYESTKAESQRAEAKLALYGVTESSSKVDQLFILRSPLAGVVVEKNVNPGQELRPDMMLANASQLLVPQFVVTEPRQLWVLLDVTEMDMATLKPGLPLRILSRAFPDKVFSGHLDLLGNGLDATTRTIKARGSVDNRDQLLKAEMYVTVEVDVDAADEGAVAVASGAVFTKDSLNYLFVETGSGSFERREVVTGVEGAGKISIRKGLKAGDRVVVQGSLLLESMLEGGGS
ncbi:MAG TPA: efflux RND transporter periplasmic adaptor subunit [Opitutaceae bacterium]|nr:efflux RND transporter periplasmic adaptor subunit [Opitutaceae bacterium]